MKAISKLHTTYEYASTGIRLGADLRSKLLFASMLFRLKWQIARGSKDQRIYTANIRIGSLYKKLYFRAADIFIVHELFAQPSYITDEIRKDPPHYILDLGAHIGLATLLFKAEFPKSHIYCFEPSPQNFQLLTINTDALSHVRLYEEAVGAQAGDATFYFYPHRPSGSSLIPKKSEVNTAVEIKCNVKALDEIISSNLYLDLIKFDIEGTELEMFSNSNLVHRVKWIVGEIRGSSSEVKRLVSLFPYHEYTTLSVSESCFYIYGKRK